MADSTNTTVLVVAAAAVVVAVLWSRRASAAYPGGGRPPSGGAGSTTASPDVTGLLNAAGNLFSGLSDLAGTIYSSDDDAGYVIPGQTPQVTEQTSFIGSSCSADFQCGFGERCAGGYCVPETAEAALPSSEDFAFA